MLKLKAIETLYSGCRFRSRLEARWAVLFNALGIQWSYEPEGYETKHGWYLPDFKIGGMYFEIKPHDHQSLDTYLKLSDLDGAGNICFLLIGDPYPGNYECHQIMQTNSEYDEFCITSMEFCGCRKCRDGIVLTMGGKGEHDSGGYPTFCIGSHTCGGAGDEKIGGMVSPKLKAAFRKARSARFEHGESP